MKLGVSSYSFSKYITQYGASYLDICNEAKRIGYEGIEFVDLSLDVQQAESLQDLAKTIRKHCEQLGLEVVAYTVGADFLNRGTEEIDRIKEQVDLAALLGAKIMRHDATWSLPEGTTWRQAIHLIKDAIREVASYAQSKGIRTCTENHGYIFQDAHRVEELILAVNHPNYGWLIDIGNFLCADELPINAVPIAAPYAFHVHVKDFLYRFPCENDPGEGWFKTRNNSFLRGTVAGHGVVPIDWCLKCLRNTGYNDWLSYEFEGMEDCIPALEAAYKFLNPLT